MTAYTARAILLSTTFIKTKNTTKMKKTNTTKQPVIYSRIISVFVLVVATFAQFVSPTLAGASQITNRSLTLVAGTTDGGSKPGGVVNHSLTFTIPSTTAIGSIQFMYCTLAAGTCTTPTGLVTTTATIGSQAGVTGWSSLVNTTNGTPYLTRGSAISPTANTAVTYQLNTITNPTTANETFYVRISTFASTDTSGGAVDGGTVAASTATPIVVSGTMPESLVFCTGGTVSVNVSSVPDCSTATSGAVSFNQLFSPTDTATATSQMAASTNAGFGYAITVNGPTLTSGSNTITAMAAATTSVHGISQFGMNLKANTTATSTIAVGTEVAPLANGTNYRGQATTGYNTGDSFQFNTADKVADSANGGAGGSDAQIFTVSYIVNVPGSQPAGTYTSTLTYICTPTY